MLAPFLALALMQNSLTPLNRGSALYASCQATISIADAPSAVHDYQASAKCLAYLDGFTDGLNFTTNVVCVEGASLGTLARIYVAYMQKHPKMMDDSKSIGVTLALVDSYPCAPSKK